MLMKYFQNGQASASSRAAPDEAARQRAAREQARARMERALRASLQLTPADEVMIRENLCGQEECGGVETFIRVRRACGAALSVALPGTIASQGIAGTGHAIFALAGFRGQDNPFQPPGAQNNASPGA